MLVSAIGFLLKLKSKTPSLLEHEDPVIWKIYPIEYIIAEKLQTLLDRGSANSRAKDVYDLIFLFPRTHDWKALFSSIKDTFENRETYLPDSFEKKAAQIDKTILSHGWPGVKILQEKLDFNSAWALLMKNLHGLDSEFFNLR
jgi:hypothetical protein